MDNDDIPSVLPVQKNESVHIGVGFGLSQHPLYNTQQSHFGVDVLANENTKVISTADGVVEQVGNSKTKGHFVVINHGNGFKTTYANVSGIQVKEGQKVLKMEPIAFVGEVKTTSDHQVHYEVEKNGVKENPEEYL